MSLTKVSYSMISGAFVNVLDYGADPTGVASSVAAFQAAVAYCQANNNTLYLPAGTYLIDSPVNLEASPLYNFSMVGAGDGHTGFTGAGRTVIKMTGNTTYAFAMGYSMRISNFVVTGGVDFIHWNSSGLDGNTTYIENISCQSISGIFFKVYTAGNGSQIIINNCQFTDYLYFGISTTFCVFDNLTNDIATDSLTMTGCWIETYSNASFKLSNVKFQLDNTRLVPYSSAGYWIVNGGTLGPASIILTNTDFGGEFSGRKLLSASVTGLSFTATNCSIYHTTTPIMDFYATPTSIIFNNCGGFVDAQTGVINFDSTMTEVEKAKLSKTQIQFNRTDNNGNLDAYVSNLDNLSFAEVARQPSVPINRVCTYTDLIATTGSSKITSSTTTGVTSTTLYDSIGNAGSQLAYEVTDAGGGGVLASFNTDYNISTLPNGNYTYELYATCTGLVKVNMATGSSGSKYFELAQGCYQLCLPNTLSTNNDRFLQITVSGLFGTKFAISRIRVWKGFHLSRATEIYSSAVPSGAGNIWFVGDKVINSAPTVGQPIGWICTVSGTPGTWVAMANL